MRGRQMSDGFEANLLICATHSIQKKIPTLSEKEILHGVLNDRSSFSILNHLILVGNYFLYSNALEDNILKHLMTGPEGNSEFCFPRISVFPERKSRETLRFEGKKIHCFPRDQSLSDLL